MSYFLRFPKITYMGYENVDITFRAAMREKLLENVSTYEPYRIKDGDRIEDLADKLYGDSGLHWIIMLMNQISDPLYEWPLNTVELALYVSGKYGTGSEYDVHHYEDSNGRVFTEESSGLTPISNSDYEAEENEKFREIKLLKPQFVSSVILEFETLLGQA